jgi:hypothetical protein
VRQRKRQKDSWQKREKKGEAEKGDVEDSLGQEVKKNMQTKKTMKGRQRWMKCFRVIILLDI